MTRREAREKAVQVLYQLDIRGIEVDEAMRAVAVEDGPAHDAEFLRKLVEGVLAHQSTLDQAIQQYLRGWTIDRLAFVDRAVLRIAAYEILHEREIPDKVSLNEAIELTRAFGMEESVKYINAVLANLVKQKEEGVQVGDE